tara:strand:- start:275 stop:544 length:270 start_codon:yes stop_codon:yes gene_type:complete
MGNEPEKYSDLDTVYLPIVHDHSKPVLGNSDLAVLIDGFLRNKLYLSETTITHDDRQELYQFDMIKFRPDDVLVLLGDLENHSTFELRC